MTGPRDALTERKGGVAGELLYIYVIIAKSLRISPTSSNGFSESLALPYFIRLSFLLNL